MCKENMKTVPEAAKPAAEESVIQHEDAALKTAFLYFSEELLPYFGITKKAVGIAATELVKLDVQKLHEDFNFIMEDGSWIHFEFQSRNKGRKDLKRFRMYEATASYQHNAAITTYVLFSGNVKRPMTEYTEGINTFCIKPITMKSHSADRLIVKLQKSQENAEKLKKEDLVLLTLCLLMDGEMPLKDRVRAAFRITQEAGDDYEEMDRIEAVLYVMADKFLDSVEMDELMEVIGMTRLGQKLVNRGMEQGFERGMEHGMEQERLEIAEGLIGILDERIIAERTRLPLETVLKLKERQESAPVL